MGTITVLEVPKLPKSYPIEEVVGCRDLHNQMEAVYKNLTAENFKLANVGDISCVRAPEQGRGAVKRRAYIDD